MKGWGLMHLVLRYSVRDFETYVGLFTLDRFPINKLESWKTASQRVHIAAPLIFTANRSQSFGHDSFQRRCLSIQCGMF